MSASSSGKQLRRILRTLRVRYGAIDWWPGDRDEVMIGAILTQQTRWENVVRALDNLRGQGICSIARLADADAMTIEHAVRCTGFFRIKSRRLQALARHVMETFGSVAAMEEIPTDR